jgi:hypothetical protein
VFLNIKLDHAGMAEMLKSAPVAAVIASATEEVAANAADTDGSPYPVAVHHYTTDRAAGSVSIPEAAQAIRGSLTKGAAAAGLEVSEG